MAKRKCGWQKSTEWRIANGKWYYLLMLFAPQLPLCHCWLFVYLKSTLSVYALSICSHFHSIRCLCGFAFLLYVRQFRRQIFSLLHFFRFFVQLVCLFVGFISQAYTLTYDIFCETSNHFRKFAFIHRTYDNVIEVCTILFLH